MSQYLIQQKVLQRGLEQETDGTHLAAIGAIEHESDLFEDTCEFDAEAFTAELHER